MATATSTKGLILDIEGAPNTPHFIPGVPGLYRPDIATPIDASIDAKALDADPSIPLKFAPLTAESEQAASDAITDSKNAQRMLKRARNKGGEAVHLTDEIDATRGA